MITLNRGVVSLTGYFGCGVGFEGAVGGSGAWREGFGTEFWGGVVAY